jgi:hypothetical protein
MHTNVIGRLHARMVHVRAEACRHDGINPACRRPQFSADNPWVASLNRAERAYYSALKMAPDVREAA